MRSKRIGSYLQCPIRNSLFSCKTFKKNTTCGLCPKVEIFFKTFRLGLVGRKRASLYLCTENRPDLWRYEKLKTKWGLLIVFERTWSNKLSLLWIKNFRGIRGVEGGALGIERVLSVLKVIENHELREGSPKGTTAILS